METVQLLCMAVSMAIIPSRGKLPDHRAQLACDMMPHIIKEAEANNLRPALLLSVIYVESGWKKTAISHSNACGLTQIVPKWTGYKQTRVPKLTCRELHNPKLSITMGSRILNYWITKYGRGNEVVGLCGYNKGFRCKGSNPHKTGMRYARTVKGIEKKINSTIQNIKKNHNVK